MTSGIAGVAVGVMVWGEGGCRRWDRSLFGTATAKREKQDKNREKDDGRFDTHGDSPKAECPDYTRQKKTSEIWAISDVWLVLLCGDLDLLRTGRFSLWQAQGQHTVRDLGFDAVRVHRGG